MVNSEMMLIAAEYYDVAMRCWEEAQVIPGSMDKPVLNTRLMFVGVMNMAFSIEVSLKARIESYDKIHLLNDLFNALSLNEQKIIIDESIEILEEYKFCWDEKSFRFCLDQSSDNFIQARYSFERGSFMVSPIFLDAFAQVLLKTQGITRPWRWAKPIHYPNIT